MIVYLEDTEGRLCFRHAVKKALEGSCDVEIKTYDDSDCGETGYWWIGDCYECNKKEEGSDETDDQADS